VATDRGVPTGPLPVCLVRACAAPADV